MYNLLSKKLSHQYSNPVTSNLNILRISPQTQRDTISKGSASIRGLHAYPKKKSGVRTFVKGFVFLEIGLFVGSYLLWKRMNDSREFRKYLNNNYPAVLEGTYLQIFFVVFISIRIYIISYDLTNINLYQYI